MATQPPIVQQPTNTTYQSQPPGAAPPPIVEPPGMGHGQLQYETPFQAGFPAAPPPMLPPREPIPGVPIGLEPLIPLGYLFVKQQIEILENVEPALTPEYGYERLFIHTVTMGVETPNRYDVLTGNGQRIYLAIETTPAIDLKYFGASRAFTIDIMDSFGRTVMILNRVYASSGMQMFVKLGDGSKLGMVLVKGKCCSSTDFHIMDENDEVVMVLKIQTTNGGCCRDGKAPDFLITTKKESEAVGFIRKTFAGFVQEYLTDADNFGVEFPPDLNVRWKGLLFASVFLIDFLFFESSTPQYHRNRS